MAFIKKQSAEKLEIAFNGRLDAQTAPKFDEEIKTFPQEIIELILDLTELSYISSAGLRTFFTCSKIMKKQGKMIIKNANNTIMEILKTTGFTQLAEFE